MNTHVAKRALAIFLVVLAAACSWYEPITERATQDVDAGLQRALVSFATARALNGVISVLQGTEVAVQPVGVGVSMSLGEILDPINDLVESLSSVMLMASVAFGVEKLLIAIGASLWVSVAVTLVALLWAVLHFRRQAPVWLTRAMLALLFARFAMPVCMLGSAYVFERFSAADYALSQQTLEGTSGQLKAFAEGEAAAPETPPSVTQAPAAEAAEPTLTDRLTGWLPSWRSVNEALPSLPDPSRAVRERYESLIQVAESAARRMIDLITVFVMQTVVVPLVLLWGLYRVLLGLARAPVPSPRPAGP